MAHFTNHSFFSPIRYAWLLSLMLIVLSIYCFLNPFVLSIDSAYGFLAYKGTRFFHLFNVVQEIPTSDIGRINHVFMSWWSPGQWIFPGILNYIFGIRLGMAAIIVTLVSIIFGFIGYYRVFVFYKFPPVISSLSLLIIFSSSTFYYCFIIYQGGEILEFALFPWFLLYVVRIREISIWSLFGIAALFLLCFIAKTTLLIYCTLVLLAKLFMLSKVPSGRFRLTSKGLQLLLPALVLLILINIFYLSRGPRPALIHHFDISAEGILVPLTAPLSSILSIQQWIERSTKIFSGSLHGTDFSVFILASLYLVVFCVLLWLMKCLILKKEIDSSYKDLFFILYAGLMVFFLFAYSFNANIDFSSRHYKLLGFLFVPGLTTILFDRFRHWLIHTIAILFCLLSLSDIIYLKEKWIKDRYIGSNYFYRNCEPPPIRDKLDRASYDELLNMDQRFTRKSEAVIFFVESSADIAVDLHHPFIIQKPDENIYEKIYQKSGPALFVCISKNSLLQETGILQLKFPQYRNFERIAETEKYLFLLSKRIK